jgi:NADH dehydrogenase
VLRRLRGEPVPAFRYSNRGDMAVIGRLAGVTDIPWLGPFGRLGGFPAWVMWLTIHIVYLIGFANRIVVSVRWAWSFLTRGRSTRLITGSPLIPPIVAPGLPDPALDPAADQASAAPGDRDAGRRGLSPPARGPSGPRR